jgi:hypothetical protein
MKIAFAAFNGTGYRKSLVCSGLAVGFFGIYFGD